MSGEEWQDARTRLPHASAERFAAPPGLDDEGRRAHQQRADGRAESLAEADRHLGRVKVRRKSVTSTHGHFKRIISVSGQCKLPTES